MNELLSYHEVPHFSVQVRRISAIVMMGHCAGSVHVTLSDSRRQSQYPFHVAIRNQTEAEAF